MNVAKTLISSGVLAALVGVPSPGFAQRTSGGHSREGATSRGTAVSRGESSNPRGGGSRQENNAQRESRAPRESGAVRERSAPRENVAPRGGDSGQRSVVVPGGGVTSRSYNGAANNGGSYNRGSYNGGSHNGGSYSSGSHNGGSYNRGSYNHGSYYRGGYNRGYVRVAPVRYYRPYYSFRPHLSLGFGLWVGYPIAFSYGYYDPYYYPYSYPYPSAYPTYSAPYPAAPYPAYPPASAYPQQQAYPPSASGSIGVQPGQGNTANTLNPSNTGGVSFEITPGDAEVLVDGNLIGIVADFTPSTQPVGLPVGAHRIEIRAPGYRTITFDVNIVAGQVLPYQGAMELAR